MVARDAAGYEFPVRGLCHEFCFSGFAEDGEAYKGFRKGRWWDLELSDIERLRHGVNEIDVITPSIAYWGRTAIHGDKNMIVV